MSNHAECARVLRQELKGKFPGIKFSIRSHSYAGGSSIRVNWLWGPSTDEVSLITRNYTYGDFNGMTDMYEYDPTKGAGPKVSYIFLTRTTVPFSGGENE